MYRQSKYYRLKRRIKARVENKNSIRNRLRNEERKRAAASLCLCLKQVMGRDWLQTVRHQLGRSSGAAQQQLDGRTHEALFAHLQTAVQRTNNGHMKTATSYITNHMKLEC
jgi:hypothetical protein